MELSLQRRKVVVLASSIACFSACGPALLNHFKGERSYHFVIIAWALLIASLLVYTISEFIKLKRSEHE